MPIKKLIPNFSSDNCSYNFIFKIVCIYTSYSYMVHLMFIILAPMFVTKIHEYSITFDNSLIRTQYMYVSDNAHVEEAFQ